MADRAPGRLVHARVVAAVLAAMYVLLSATYILASSRLAAASARSVQQLEQWERVKGVLFVAGTGALFFLVADFFLRRLQRQREALLASEHRALSGLLASSIAHDINNLTMVAQGSAEILLMPGPKPESRQTAAANLNDVLQRLTALSKRLMAVGRSGGMSVLQDRDLVAAIERALDLARRHERVRGCKVTTQLGDSLAMPLDEVLVDRMILNLVLNAADATSGRGKIDLRVRRKDGQIVLEMHDNGPGVPDDAREAIFDPFYSSKTRGLGLGLLSVRAFAEVHGGSVEVKPSDLGGACFRVTVPLRNEAP
jgi:signal transduction histidine kinase